MNIKFRRQEAIACGIHPSEDYMTTKVYVLVTIQDDDQSNDENKSQCLQAQVTRVVIRDSPRLQSKW
jgi:hypothetical protein